MKLFYRAWEELLSSNMDRLVDVSVKRLEGKDLTVALLVKERDAFAIVADKLGKKVSGPFAVRDILVQYRGAQIPCAVTSYMDTRMTKVEALTRTICADNNLLIPLWCESELVGVRTIRPERVEKNLYVASVNARLTCSEFLEGDQCQVGALIRDTLTKKMKFLRTIDRFFKIEAGLFFSSIGAGAEDRLSTAILACLPSAQVDGSMTVLESLGRLDAVSKGKLAAFCGTSLHSTFGCIRGYVQSLSDKRCPRFGTETQSPMLNKVREALARFCAHDVAASSAVPAAKLHGKAALNAKYDLLILDKEKHKSEVAYADLEISHTFEWLLNDGQWDRLQQLTDALMMPLAASGNVGPPNAKKGRRPSSAKDADAIVKDLYD
jgi:hypothetical protein